MEEINAKYTSMIDEFKKQCIQMLDQSVGALSEIIKSANTNFENVKNSYKKGSTDMKNEILKGNLSMVESFRRNCKVIQQNIDDAYNILRDENMEVFTKNCMKFQEQCSSAVKKNPALGHFDFQAVIDYLLTKQKTSLEVAHATHKVYAKKLQESYDDTARKLTMTEKSL